jgi:hypothetical protein
MLMLSNTTTNVRPGRRGGVRGDARRLARGRGGRPSGSSGVTTSKDERLRRALVEDGEVLRASPVIGFPALSVTTTSTVTTRRRA